MAAPTANATATEAEAAPTVIATTSFTAMYAAGRSGVSRSWRLQPAARSIETVAPAAAVASMAP